MKIQQCLNIVYIWEEKQARPGKWTVVSFVFKRHWNWSVLFVQNEPVIHFTSCIKWVWQSLIKKAYVVQLIPWKMRGIFSNLKQMLCIADHTLPFFKWKKVFFLTLTAFVIQLHGAIQDSPQREEKRKKRKERKEVSATWTSKYH